MNNYNNYDYQKEVNEAIQSADNALYYLNNANQYLDSAGGWGILDLLGGGFISTLAKHSKMNKAQQELQQAKYAVQDFKKELQDVGRIDNIDVNVGDFLTFADFFFDGFVADWLVQSKIRDAQKQINDAIYQITYIKNQLLANR
jgi:hypothetical protein